MAMYTNIGGTSKELEYLRFNKDGAIQGITDAYANIDANSKKIFGTIEKSYWWKKYPCTEYELVKMAIGDIPLVNNTSAMTDMTLYNYGNISDGKYTLDNSGTVMDGVLYVSDESVLNSFNKSSGEWNNLFSYGSEYYQATTGYFYMKAGPNDTVNISYTDETQSIFHGTMDKNDNLTVDYIYYIKPSKFSDTYSIIKSSYSSTHVSPWFDKKIEINSKFLFFKHLDTYWLYEPRYDGSKINQPIFLSSRNGFDCGLYEYLGYFA